jgi:hypothetical protein
MSDLEKSVDLLHDKIDDLSEKIATIPYRIKMLERIVFGLIGMILTAFTISICSLVIHKFNEPVPVKTVAVSPSLTSR